MRVLHLEDNERDATLVRDLLEQEWPGIQLTWTTRRDEYVRALAAESWNVILSDFRLPDFGGKQALAIAAAAQPGVPFIFVSGTIGEDAAAESVRAGAADYVLKDRLQRLPLSIRRALADSDERQKRQAAEEQLREQADLLNKVQDGIVVTDLGHRVRYWNHGAERIFGWLAAEAVGCTMADLFGETLAPAFRAMEEQLLMRGEWRGELALGSKLQRQMLVEFRVTTVRDAAGAPKNYLKIITDITDRRRLEDQLFRAQRLESLGMLAAGIAHDLNNALAPMLMAGGLLRSRVSDPADIRLVELLERSAERGASLVKQIVSFAGGRSRDRMLIQPRHVLRDILLLLQDTFPKSIRIEHDFATSLWPVNGDPTQLHQVLLNLTINARDAMPQGGTLRLRGYNDVVDDEVARRHPGALAGKFVVFEVADTGIGIPPEIIGEIWQPFFTTKSEDKGTGLGLSTVRGIVANHGGFITVDSAPGRGSTFRAYLPTADEGQNVIAGPEEARPKGGRGEVIFVVDDQATVRESISAVLAQNGYRPLPVADGIEALAKFADRIRDVAVVITDLDMPGLTGGALAQSILHLNPEVKILFVSGTRPLGPGVSIPTSDTVLFLAKPFSPADLLSKVDELLHPGAVPPAA